MKTPSKIYSPPGYVQAFSIAGMLCALLGIIAIGLALIEGGPVWGGVGLLLAAFANFLYAQMADGIARTHWRVERLAHELQPVIDEANYQADERVKRDRLARADQEAEIRRVLEQRQAASRDEPPA